MFGNPKGDRLNPAHHHDDDEQLLHELLLFDIHILVIDVLVHLQQHVLLILDDQLELQLHEEQRYGNARLTVTHDRKVVG